MYCNPNSMHLGYDFSTELVPYILGMSSINTEKISIKSFTSYQRVPKLSFG